MRITINHEAALAEDLSLTQQPILVARASFLILVALGILLIPSQFAMASCGDYLHHRYTTPINVERTESHQSQLPAKCTHCSSRSETPAPLPLRTLERIEKAPANLSEQRSSCLILGEFIVDIQLLADAQCFREVSTPPPKRFL